MILRSKRKAKNHFERTKNHFERKKNHFDRKKNHFERTKKEKGELPGRRILRVESFAMAERRRVISALALRVVTVGNTVEVVFVFSCVLTVQYVLKYQ